MTDDPFEWAAVRSLRLWSKPPFSGSEATFSPREVASLVNLIDRQEEMIAVLEGQLEAAESLMEFNDG